MKELLATKLQVMERVRRRMPFDCERKYGRWNPIALTSIKNGVEYWRCRCECGTEREKVSVHDLRKGKSLSCGCLRRERTSEATKKHGLVNTPAYRTWSAMRQRCTNPNFKFYSYYGGRGISVCERWQNSFESFLADMGQPPEGCSLDRIDSNGNYEPGNCRWATRTEQMRNTRACRILTFAGQSMCVADWADQLGINAEVIHARLCRKWPIERVLSPLTRKAS